MIVYMVDTGGEYISVAESLRRNSSRPHGLYVNLTNRCPCSCTFCLRTTKPADAEHSLWLEREPSVGEVTAAFETAPWPLVNEVVFCGFGEPTERLPELTALLRWLKANHPGVPTRLNTNGLSDLIHQRDTAPDFDGLLDTVSISLNASNAERYLALTRSKFGLPSYEAMLAFAEHCKAHVPRVVLTVVDHVEDAGEIARCRRLCDERSLSLRVRVFERA